MQENTQQGVYQHKASSLSRQQVYWHNINFVAYWHDMEFTGTTSSLMAQWSVYWHDITSTSITQSLLA